VATSQMLTLQKLMRIEGKINQMIHQDGPDHMHLHQLYEQVENLIDSTKNNITQAVNQ
jgi:hypothetical protein